MKNILLCLLLVLSTFCFPVQAQVYFAQYLENEVFVGPENVSIFFPGIKDYYLNRFDEKLNVLEADKNEVYNKQLEAGLSPPKQRALANTYTKIQQEISHLNEMKQHWQDFDEYKFNIFFLDNDYCFELNYRDTIYNQTNAHFSINEETSTIQFVEFVDAKRWAMSSKWRQIENPKYKNDKTEERYIFCPETVYEYFFEDNYYTKVNLNRISPLSAFSYDSVEKQLVKKVEVTLKKPTSTITVIKFDNNQSLPPAKLTLQECP
ncbi:MAG: hypothetical protein R2798_08995 [Chitinophagales bacterium]|nr:hypothetical protein [Bacteroidota bacterium]MCB9043911.1 hypothetical protein [Chitinophagales bacterium]